MDSTTVAHLHQCWEAHKNKQRELKLVHDNLLKSCLQAIAEGYSIEDVMTACGFSTGMKEVECQSIFGRHVHNEPGVIRFAHWLTNELGEYLAGDNAVETLDEER